MELRGISALCQNILKYLQLGYVYPKPNSNVSGWGECPTKLLLFLMSIIIVFLSTKTIQTLKKHFGMRYNVSFADCNMQPFAYWVSHTSKIPSENWKKGEQQKTWLEPKLLEVQNWDRSSWILKESVFKKYQYFNTWEIFLLHKSLSLCWGKYFLGCQESLQLSRALKMVSEWTSGIFLPQYYFTPIY